MIETTPQVFLISRPSVDWGVVKEYLDGIGGLEWFDRIVSSDLSDGEKLVEFMGRLCYRSWAPGLNPNVSKVRKDSTAYLLNIIKSMHGSVLEHANYSFIFKDVSRVFTHELVRHRVGVGISQESLRYVRVNDVALQHPEYVKDSPVLLEAANELIKKIEEFQALSFEITGIDSVDFHTKKIITSAARRYLPEGISTTVGWTANIRALRHVISMRTDYAAETELRYVFDRVAEIMDKEIPSLLTDFTRDATGRWFPEYRKV